MGWQAVLTAIAVLLAAAVVVRAAVLPLFGKGRAGCGSGCGKCGTSEAPPQPGRIWLPQI